MDVWLLYGLTLFIAYLTALWWRRRCGPSKASNVSADSEGTKSVSEQEKPCSDIGQERETETLTALSEQEKPCSDIGQERETETLTALSPKVEEDNKIEENKHSDVSDTPPEKLEPSGDTDEFPIVSEKKLCDDNTNESESAEPDIVKSSRSLRTELEKDICNEALNTSVEEHLAEAVLYPEDSQDLENSFVVVESVEAQKDYLLSGLPGPTHEVQNRNEGDGILKELEPDRVSEESLNLQQKTKSFEESEVATGVKTESEETSKKSNQQILNAESPETSVEEVTLETFLKTSEQTKETEDGVRNVLADELHEEKTLGGSRNKLEEKETIVEDSGTAEEKTTSEFSLKIEEKQVTSTEVSDTSEVREPFDDSRGKEGRDLIQESIRVLGEHENLEGSSFSSLEPCGESLKAINEKELSLEECSRVRDNQSNESSKLDKELSEVELDQREPSSVEFVLATQTQEELTEGYPVQKEFEVLSQGQLVQEVITTGNLLLKELAQETLAEKEQLQEELVEEKKITGELLLADKEALQETLGLEFSKAAEEEALSTDTLRALQKKTSLEEIVKAPSDQNDSLDKSEGLLEKEPDFGACFDSETIKAGQTVFCASEWQNQQNLGADKPDTYWDQALQNLSEEPLSSSSCADEAGDQNKETAEGLFHSNFSSLETATELKVIQESELASSPEELFLTHSLKHDTISSENKEILFDSHSVVDVKEKLIPVDSGIEASQELNRESFQDNFGNLNIISYTDKGLGIISDTGNSSDIISDSDKTCDQYFSVSSAAVDLSLSTSKLTDSAADSYSCETGKLDTAFITESPCLDTDTDCLAEGNLFQEAEKDLQQYDHGTAYSSLNRQSVEISCTEPITVASENTKVSEGECAVELWENIVLLGDEKVKAREKSAEISSKGARVCSSTTDFVDVTSFLELEKGKEISGLIDAQEHNNIHKIPAKESSQELEEILTLERTGESKKIPDILAEESSQEYHKILKISPEEDRCELQNIQEILGEQISEEPLVVLEISLEKSSQELQQVPEILHEVSQERDSQTFQQVPEILGVEIGQKPQKVLDISLEQNSKELYQVQEILREEISKEPQKSPEISIEESNQELQQVPGSLGEEISQEPQKILESSPEEDIQELHRVPEILSEEFRQVPEKVLESSPEEGIQEIDQISEILSVEITQFPEEILESLPEEGIQGLHQVPESLSEEISQVPQKVGEISPEEGHQEPHQVPESLIEEITLVSERVLESSPEEGIQEIHQIPQILSEGNSEVPQKVVESSPEEGLQISEILSVEITQVPEKVLESSGEDGIQEQHQVPEILCEEFRQVPQKALESSPEEGIQELHQIPEILSEEISQVPEKVVESSPQEGIQEFHQVPEILSEEFRKEPQKVLESSPEGGIQELHQFPEILSEETSEVPEKVVESSPEEGLQISEILSVEITQVPEKVLESSPEDGIQEHHQVPEILSEEFRQVPQKARESSPEEGIEEFHQIPEILSEEISQVPEKVVESSPEEGIQEFHQVPEILSEEFRKVPQKVLESSPGEDIQELYQIPKILSEEIIQVPEKVVESSAEEGIQENHQVPKILSEEFRQVPQKALESSLEGGIQQLHQIPEILSEETSEVPEKVVESSPEEDLQGIYQISEILSVEITQVPEKVLDSSPEDGSQEHHQVPEILSEEFRQVPQKALESSLEGGIQQLHQIPEILSEETSEVPEKVLESSPEEDLQGIYQISEILSVEITQVPEKVLDSSPEDGSQEHHQVPEILSEEFRQVPQKALESSPDEGIRELHQVPEILCEEFRQVPQKALDSSPEEGIQELHQVPEILCEEFRQVPQKALESSPQEGLQELDQIPEILSEEISDVSDKVVESSPEESIQEFHQVPEILSEEFRKDPQKVLESSLGQDIQELDQIPEILSEEISQVPEKVVESSAEEGIQEHHQVPEILSEEFRQVPEKALEISTEEDIQELHQIPETLSEEISSVPQKVLESSPETGIQELHEVPEILSEDISQVPEKVVESSAEEGIQKFHQVPEILSEEFRKEPQKVVRSSPEEDIRELHQIPEILSEEISQLPEKDLESSPEEGIQGLDQIPETLSEEISSVLEKVLETSPEESIQELHQASEILSEEISQVSQKVVESSPEGIQEFRQIPEIFSEEINQVPQKVVDSSPEEGLQELHQVPEILSEEFRKEPQKVVTSSPEGDIQELHQISEILSEEISQVPQKVLESSPEQDIQELDQIPEILSEEISHVPEKVVESSAEEGIQEHHQVPEILSEEFRQVPEKALEISPEEDIQGLHQIPETLSEEITSVPQKVLENSPETGIQELHEFPEILSEDISQVPEKVVDSSAEEGIPKFHQVPDILSEEFRKEPQKVVRSSPEEDIQGLHQIPKILSEEIIQVPQKALESSPEEGIQGLDQIPETLSEEISSVLEKVLETSPEESIQELHQVSEILSDEISQVSQKVVESSPEDIQELHQVPENLSEEISQVPLKVLEISAEGDNQDLQKDQVFSQDRIKLLVHQLEMTAQSQIRFLVLNLNENHESRVFRLERGWTLQFFLGPTLANSPIRLFVNHPLQGAMWDKNAYRELEWNHLPSLQLDVCEGHADVTMIQAGSFRYYFTVDGSDSKDHANGCGFFLVDPDLVIGKSQEKLPLDGIICQTVMSKLLGPFPEWEGRLRVAKETGYNVIHFTPLQELGASNSAYALRDQLKLNPVFHTSDRTFDFEDVERLVEVMNNEYELLSFTDLVLNHTANESPWISEHPEGVYNLVNSPHLKPAYLLDRRLRLFSVDVADGVWESEGIPPTLNNEKHLERIATVLHTSVLPELRLSEFYQVSVDEVLDFFRSLIVSGFSGDEEEESELRIIPDPDYRRLRSTVNLHVAFKLFYISLSSDIMGDKKIQLAVDGLRSELEKLNARADAVVSEHLSIAVKNFVANARYRFVDANGLRLSAVTHEQPIMNRYFVNSHGYLSMEEEEKLMHSEKAAYCMAHNGWVPNIDNPFGNFAETGSDVYLRRELNSWEDSVKLRYGDTPDDCPYLWELMHRYATQTAQIFHGVRLDNCHNTPIHVVEWMLAECRAVRPDLYVMAELYTPSEHFDNIYINRLGLNSMIREALGAGDARNLSSRLVSHSSEPVGAFFQLPLRPLTSSLIHDILFDQTHDNPSIVDQRSVLDVLPNAALVAMVKCAVASTRGYDEVIPHHISVITESRLYRSWSTDDIYDSSNCVGIKTGIIAAKRALNKLHWKLTVEGFSQISVEHLTDNIVVVTRHNPITYESIVLVAHTAFRRHHPDSGTSFIPSLPVQGHLSEVILEAQVVTDTTKTFVPDEKHICGLDSIQLIMKENIDISESETVRVQLHDNLKVVEFVQFPASSVIVFRLLLDDSTDTSLTHLRHLLACFGYKMRTPGTDANAIVSAADCTELEEIFTELTLKDLNLVLFRCDAEEKDDGYGYGIYHVPGFGDLPFCGLAGVMSVLMAIRASNNLDHPLCRNLKEGNWMLDYLSGRLLCHQGTKRLGTWLEIQFGHIKNLPRSLVPCYFDAFVTGVFVALEELAWKKMGDFIMKGSAFVRALALASLQVCGVSRSASLPGLSPHLDPPIPVMIVDAEGHPQMDCITITAGLPHFSSGSFRCWGRDTFISMRGLLLVTGRFDEARFLILAFAGFLRHGLIPNFLGCGSLEPRYNSRDAVWWWLQAIQDYCNMAPRGIAILKDKVSRCYPTDDSSLLPPGACDQLLCDVIQEALQKHASGVKFRERNAGPTIDNDMTSAGFDVECGIDWTTGFIFGGNEHNCGTWMDKMGSSQAAGNLGKPATPRHGSAVEIVGLCYSAVKWLDNLSQQSLFPYNSVSVLQDDVLTQITFHSWCDLIAKNFEPKFWIDYDPLNDPHPELVNRRGIYRDVYQCSHKWSEYQLRPNFAIAIALAPELCNIDHAWAAMEQAGEVLMGPLGLKTLDPSDWEYSGFYDNSHWSMDYKTACGFSYHQGPEWIWPVGFFLRAMLQVAKHLEDQHAEILRDTLSNVRRILSAHHTFIHVSDWKSLPELTNENGEFCASSCPSQAWSIACILDSLYDAEKILQTTPINDHDHSSN